ncbi:MAG: ribonuclease P protein component [Planctomycetaceae bacterium]|jgi:ribonuclease P protein component|nr:ribonuclease P protein component [Planctomycetaceae bacterium]
MDISPQSREITEKFPQTARIRKSPEFKRVFDARCSAADQVLIVFAIPNGLEQNRLGLSVSKKVGGAVTRNRWKRLIREAFRKIQYGISETGVSETKIPETETSEIGHSETFDFVVIPQRNTALPTAQTVKLSLQKLVNKLIKKNRMRF